VDEAEVVFWGLCRECQTAPVEEVQLHEHPTRGGVA
jgi:Fur family ferric uptake transcriptional regulator